METVRCEGEAGWSGGGVQLYRYVRDGVLASCNGEAVALLIDVSLQVLCAMDLRTATVEHEGRGVYRRHRPRTWCLLHEASAQSPRGPVCSCGCSRT